MKLFPSFWRDFSGICLRGMFTNTSVLVLGLVFLRFRRKFSIMYVRVRESFTAWTNSTVISSRCQLVFKWIDRSLNAMMYVWIFTLLVLWLSEPPQHTDTPLASWQMGNHRTISTESVHLSVMVTKLWNKMIVALQCHSSYGKSLRIKLDLNSLKKQWKNWKLVSPSQWIASYVARSSHGMLVITLIHLLPFDNKL